jgi:hypothetical protein
VKTRSLTMAVATVLAYSFVVSTASASPASKMSPDWSGMDVRHYSGPIPDQHGIVIESVPLSARIAATDFPRNPTPIRFLYSTPTQHSDSGVSTAVLYQPSQPAPADGYPVVAFAHGTSGIADECAPSVNSYRPNIGLEADYIQILLDAGYAVVATDYAGSGTPGTQSYANSAVQGANVIDSVIASRSLGVSLASRWGITGYSQGGGAAVGAAHILSTYAPAEQSNYRGAMSLAGPANLESVVPLLGPGFLPVNVDALNPRFTLYVALVLTSVREAYPELDLDAALTPEGRRVIDEAANTCLADIDDLGEFNHLVLGDLFTRPLWTVTGLADKIREMAGSPTTGVSGPLLLMQGLLDTDVPATVSNVTTAPALRANGTDVRVVVEPTDTHLTLIDNSYDETLDFFGQHLMPVR